MYVCIKFGFISYLYRCPLPSFDGMLGVKVPKRVTMCRTEWDLIVFIVALESETVIFHQKGPYGRLTKPFSSRCTRDQGGVRQPPESLMDILGPRTVLACLKI